jgi:membrane-bound lytic murein transglycosylase D
MEISMQKMHSHKPTYIICSLLILCFINSSFSLSKEKPEIFPTPKKMETNVAFWKRIYTEISTEKGFVHDSENLDIIYETYNIPKGSRRSQNERINKRKTYFKKQLKKLAKNPNTNDPQLKEIAALWKDKNPTSQTYLGASQKVRFQRGQQDKFLDGFRRSKNYSKEMREILRKEEIPEDFVYLPHVESSFNCQARSKRGAVGIWQFIYATGKRYMKINRLIDERKDPLVSTIAAAKLLKHNYEKLQSWPLALIAYNYGTNGVVRATKQHNTNDFEYILDNYKKRRFSFATKNFYAEFLAAREIVKNSHLYFDTMGDDREDPEIEIIYLDSKTRIKSILKRYNLTRKEFLRHNPAIKSAAIYKNYHLNAGFPIYLPKEKYLAIREKISENDKKN